MSHMCNQRKVDGGYCEQMIAAGRDHCEAGHHSPPPTLSPAAALRRLPAAVSSFEVDEIASPTLFNDR